MPEFLFWPGFSLFFLYHTSAIFFLVQKLAAGCWPLAVIIWLAAERKRLRRLHYRKATYSKFVLVTVGSPRFYC